MLNIPCEWKHGAARNCTGFIVDTNVNREGKIICAIILENGEFVQAEWTDLRARRVYSAAGQLHDVFHEPNLPVHAPETAAPAPEESLLESPPGTEPEPAPIPAEDAPSSVISETSPMFHAPETVAPAKKPRKSLLAKDK